MVPKKKRPGEFSPGRNSSMIKGYVKGARNVNRKCESESLFFVVGLQVGSVELKLIQVARNSRFSWMSYKARSRVASKRMRL